MVSREIVNSPGPAPSGSRPSDLAAGDLERIQEPVPCVVVRGAHRALPFRSTIEKALRFARVMGISRIANVTGLDDVGVPVVMVVRPNSRSLAVSQGKGLDLEAAKASGLMESVESYHGETALADLRLCTYEELRYTNDVVDPEALPKITTSTFDPNGPMAWCRGWDIVRGTTTWVPYELVHTDFTLPWIPGSGCFPRTSSGLASGNHILEAVSHGICEVVERDAASLWILKEEALRDQTLVDMDSIDDPDCRSVLAAFERAGIRTAIWEITSDIGIASFSCIIEPKERSSLRPLPVAGGYGCHPSRSIALLRAMTEAAQSRLTQISGSRDDMSSLDYEQIRDPEGESVLSTAAVNGPHPRSFHDAPNHIAATLNEDVDWEVELLRRAGFGQVVMVDLTKPIFGIPVVRVIIPGLDGYHEVPGYLPGSRARILLKGRR